MWVKWACVGAMLLCVFMLSGCSSSSSSGNGAELPKGYAAALETGDVTQIKASVVEIEDELVRFVQRNITAQDAFLKSIYGAASIRYVPSRHSQFVNNASGVGDAYALLTGSNGGSFAAARDLEGFRSVGFGTNLLVELKNGQFAEYQLAMEKVVQWLVGSNGSPLHVVTSMLNSTTISKSNAWLTDLYTDVMSADCEPVDASSCLTSQVDLLVVGSSSATATEAQVQAFMARAKALRIPTLYVHLHAWNATILTDDVLAPLGFSMQGPGGPGNYFSQDSVDVTHFREMTADSDLMRFYELAQRLADDGFSYALAGCDTNRCGNVAEFASQFENIANDLRTELNGIERSGIQIFEQSEYGLLKRMVLLGDLYRQQVTYPMDKNTVGVNSFTKALYADYAIYNLRDHNPVPADLGNFSRTDFSHITATSTTVTITSRNYFRAAGVYALPGQTVTVTRNDSQASLEARVFVNTQRSGATHIFETDGYNRPKFLQTAGVTIAPGQTIRFTSAYGGPIQIGFSEPGVVSEFTFNQIGQHPYWSTGMGNAAFLAGIAKAEYDWAEIASDRFEIHSTLQKMQDTLSDVNFSTPSIVASEAMENLYNQAHRLAGFTGPHVNQESEIMTYTESLNYTVPTMDIVKHMNADQATCGYGCSGNPYDAYWTFNPIGHGDLHEFGHGLENRRFKPDGRDGHATTNFYSYYSKSKYAQRTGQPAQCQGLPFEAHYNLLQAAQHSADPFAYMNAADINGWSDGALFMIQVFMIAQQQGALSDGWLTLPRLHLYSRAFDAARKDETSWLNARTALGLGSLGFSDAELLTSNNDFLLLALSHGVQLDFRDYFSLYGLEVSTLAANQVAAKGLTAVSRTFYAPTDRGGYCDSLAQPALAIDGTTEWPY